MVVTKIYAGGLCKRYTIAYRNNQGEVFEYLNTLNFNNFLVFKYFQKTLFLYFILEY